MNKEFTVRPYLPGDAVGIVDLLKLAFNGWPKFELNCKPQDHWKWKYLDTPLKKNSISVAISDDATIGCDHTGYRKIKIGKESMLCGHGTDSAVHPEYRRIGVYTKLKEKKDEMNEKNQLKIGYWITGNPIFIKKYSRIRQSFPQPIKNLVKIHDIDAQLKAIPFKNNRITKLGFQTLKTMNRIENTLKKRALINRNLNTRQENEFDDQTEILWRKTSKNYSLIFERDRDYLNWRYCDKRSGDFKIFKVNEDDALIGYSVLSINRSLKDYPIGFILDFLTLPNRLDVAEILVREAIDYFDENYVNLVNYLIVKGHPYEKIFRRNGFLDSRIKFHMFFQTNNQNIRARISKMNTYPAGELFFSWGDHDSLPVKKPEAN